MYSAQEQVSCGRMGGRPSSGRGKLLKALDFVLRAKGAMETVGKSVQWLGLFLGKIVQTTKQCTDSLPPLHFLAMLAFTGCVVTLTLNF